MGRTRNEIPRLRESRDYPAGRPIGPAGQTHTGEARHPEGHVLSLVRSLSKRRARSPGRSLRGFWREAQRVQEKRIWASLPSSLRIAWKGVLKPRHFLGVRLAVMAVSWVF